MLQFHWLSLWRRLTQNTHLDVSVLARPLSEGTVPLVEMCPLPALCPLRYFSNHLKYLTRQGFTGLPKGYESHYSPLFNKFLMLGVP